MSRIYVNALNLSFGLPLSRSISICSANTDQSCCLFDKSSLYSTHCTQHSVQLVNNLVETCLNTYAKFEILRQFLALEKSRTTRDLRCGKLKRFHRPRRTVRFYRLYELAIVLGPFRTRWGGVSRPDVIEMLETVATSDP